MNLVVLNDENLRKINVGYERMTLEAIGNNLALSTYMMPNSPYMKGRQANRLWWFVYTVAFNQAIENALQGKEADIQLDYDMIISGTNQKNLRKINQAVNQLIKHGLLVPTDNGYLVMHPEVNVKEWFEKENEEYIEK